MKFGGYKIAANVQGLSSPVEVRIVYFQLKPGFWQAYGVRNLMFLYTLYPM
jgi:hypothetical protein